MKPVVIQAAVLAVAMLGCAVISPAQAAKPSKSDPVMDALKDLDRNGNGCIDFEEGRNYSSRRFHALDKNGDGVLDANELKSVGGEEASASPISLEQWADAYPARFAAIDTDGNGCATEQEIRATMPEANKGGQ